jgi:long-chain acyl-CoA synthetase
MAGESVEPDWLRAEREYVDEVIGTDTLARAFEASADRNANRTAQRYKGGVSDRSLVSAGVIPPAPAGGFAGLTYGRLREIVHDLAAGFRELGVRAGDRVALFSHTRMEWTHADLALLQAGAVVTTVYAGSSPEKTCYLLDDPGATGVVVEDREALETVLSVEDELERDLAFVVTIEDVATEREDVLTLGELHGRGAATFERAALERWLDARASGDLATLIYTSGTTGRPKGVKLTHHNLRSNVNQIRKRLGPRPDRPPGLPAFDAGSTMLSFLPLAHVFERTVGQFLSLASGATVAYAESPDALAEDLRLVGPTTVVSVPRVYERIYDTIREQAAGSARERLLDRAIDCAREWARTDAPDPSLRLRHAAFDALVYRRVRERLGGNVDFLVSGGGSLSKELAELFLGMGLPVLEGYGLTETSPVLSTNPIEDIRPGTLGPPVVDVEVRFDESRADGRPHREADGPVGELLVRGPTVTDGYWQLPAATAEAFTDDGFFRTGDVIEQTADGYLRFVERVKSLLVLSTGKNVAPGPIEDAFTTADRIDQVMVVGDGRRFVGALIVPNFEAVRRWAEREGIDLPAGRRARCEDERVREYVGETVASVNERFDRYERIKRFEIVPDEWTEETGLLTPTMKKRRNSIEAYHAEAVERIYGVDRE